MGLRKVEGNLGQSRPERMSPARPGKGCRQRYGKERGQEKTQRRVLEMWGMQQAAKCSRKEGGARKQSAGRPQVKCEDKNEVRVLSTHGNNGLTPD